MVNVIRFLWDNDNDYSLKTIYAGFRRGPYTAGSFQSELFNLVSNGSFIHFPLQFVDVFWGDLSDEFAFVEKISSENGRIFTRTPEQISR